MKIVSPNEFSTVIVTLLYKKSLSRASMFKIEAQFHVKALISHQSVKTDITTRKWLLEAKGWLVEARGWLKQSPCPHVDGSRCFAHSQTPSFEQIPL